MMAAVAPSPRGQEECPRVRTMASQRDKSADLFALTARPTPSLFNSREPAGSAPWRNPSIAQVRANAADGRAMRAAEKLLRRSTKCQGTTSRAAEKLLRRSTKCQGTTGAPTQCVGRVPQAPQNESGLSRRGIAFFSFDNFFRSFYSHSSRRPEMAYSNCGAAPVSPPTPHSTNFKLNPLSNQTPANPAARLHERRTLSHDTVWNSILAQAP